MELTRDHWLKKDIKDFQEYIKSFENIEKRELATNLLKTELPVLCLTNAVIKDVVKRIYDGNYLEFLDFMVWEYYENAAINGFLIMMIKDFDTMKKYLDVYSVKADNWATCDLLLFKVKDNEQKYFDLALEYIESDKPFVKRIGLSVLLNLVSDNEYIDKIFSVLDKFELEKNYYVNMMIGWLVCECFIRQRKKTLKYLKHNKLNSFAINKGIQKCRDSRRVVKEDKNMLLKYKVK